MARRGFFYKLRILSLLFVLFLVAGNAWLTKLRATDWDRPLRVVIYPLNADGSEAVSRYINALQLVSFEPIAAFMAREASRYGLPLSDPITLYLAPEIHKLPPKPPRDRHALQVAWWSLKLRYWALRESDYDGPAAHIRIYVLYHDFEAHERLDHSLGLEKGLIGLVNAYADSGLEARNNVVTAHELLHTLGATDKYDLSNNQPHYPDGYADPDLVPRFPQQRAEIMAGRIPLSETKSVMPESLSQAVIGQNSAIEIRWID